MIKSQELSDPNSCLNKAKDDEPIFVLLGRDVTAAAVIDAWCDYRVKAGKNMAMDPQITDARAMAGKMDEYRLRLANEGPSQ